MWGLEGEVLVLDSPSTWTAQKTSAMRLLRIQLFMSSPTPPKGARAPDVKNIHSSARSFWRCRLHNIFGIPVILKFSCKTIKRDKC